MRKQIEDERSDYSGAQASEGSREQRGETERLNGGRGGGEQEVEDKEEEMEEVENKERGKEK